MRRTPPFLPADARDPMWDALAAAAAWLLAELVAGFAHYARSFHPHLPDAVGDLDDHDGGRSRPW